MLYYLSVLSKLKPDLFFYCKIYLTFDSEFKIYQYFIFDSEFKMYLINIQTETQIT